VFYSNFVPQKHRFWDIRLVSIQWPWNLGWGSLRVIGTNTDRSAAYDFLLTFHSNHGPISYRFRDKRQFSSKTANFSHPRVLCAPTEGVPPGIGYRLSGVKKTRIMGLPGQEKKFDDIFSRPDTIRQRDGQTDRRTDRRRGRQQRSRLRIASRRKRLNIARGDVIICFMTQASCY